MTSTAEQTEPPRVIAINGRMYENPAYRPWVEERQRWNKTPITHTQQKQQRQRTPPTTTTILQDANILQKSLRHDQKPNPHHKIIAYKSVENVWMSFRLCSSKERAWESLNVWRAIYLYQLRLIEIHRLSKTCYRTIQYFLHAPSRTGFTSAGRIVVATKILMAREIMRRDEPLEQTWNNWHNCDPRTIPKNLLHTLKRAKCPTSRVMLHELAARTLISG